MDSARNNNKTASNAGYSKPYIIGLLIAGIGSALLTWQLGFWTAMGVVFLLYGLLTCYGETYGA